MNSLIWNRTDKEQPPERKLVVTMTENGLMQGLYRQGNLWFTDDTYMAYVYYEPKFWVMPKDLWEAFSQRTHEGGRTAQKAQEKGTDGNPFKAT